MVKSSSSAETAKLIQKLLKDDTTSNNPRADAARLDELRRVFAGLADDLNAPNGGGGGVMPKWKTFLRNSLNEFVQQLCERIADGDGGNQLTSSSCRTMWGVIAAVPAKSNNGLLDLVDAKLLQKFVRAVCTTIDDLHHDNKHLRHMLQTEFLGNYRDVQYYTMIAIARTADELYYNQKNKKKKQTTTSSAVQQAAEGLVELLMMIPLAESQQDLDKTSSPASTIGGVGGGYLFPPPVDAVPDDKENGSSDDDGDDDESDDDDDDEELDSDVDDSGVDDEERPAKRAKVATKKRFAFQDIKQHRSVWSKAWLAVLRLPLSDAALKQALRFLPVAVLPVASSPLRFADFFMNAYSASNNDDNSSSVIVPLLALEGLFLLMTQHGLEYREFYKQLYKLIMSPSLLYVKHRTKFCRLLDKCLSRNEMLPAHVVAAFVKRLLRSSLSAPPGSCLFVLALCSNLLRKHPETSCLVHRHRKAGTTNEDYDDDDEGMQDGFDAVSDDPEQANALQSSLWELGALERHYYPAIVTIAKSIGREDELQTPLYNMEDFVAGHTYGTLFEQERNKRKRRRNNAKTPLTFQKPTGLFVDNDVFAGILAIP